MWHVLTASFAAGLAVGPACLLHCGAFQFAYVSRCSSASASRTAGVGALILLGRLAAYLLIGLLIGLLAGSGLTLPAPWVLTAGVGLLMLTVAAFPGALRLCGCRLLPGTAGSGALLLGFLTGLAPCPPLLASGFLALQSHGITTALLTFTAFFAGSSLCLIPSLFGLSLIPQRLRLVFRRGGRVLALLVAAYAFTLAGAQVSRASGSPSQLPGGPSGGTVEAKATTPSDREEPVPAPPPAPASVQPLHEKTRLKTLLTEKMVQEYNLSMREAMFYKKLADNRVQCQLCPRGCLLKEGERGLCRVRANIGGTLRSLTYARPVSINADPIEKKPLYHVLPSSTALSVATVGCNSGCVFCQNFEISQASPEDVRNLPVSPAKLVSAAVSRGDQGIAYTYTEPTVFFEYMLETAKLAREKGLRNYWITCGQIRQEPLLELCKVLDAANVDLKGFSDEFYVRYCDFHLAPVLETLRTLDREGVFVEVTNLLIPGGNDDPEMIRDMCRWIKQELGADTPLHFSRFHPNYKLRKRPPTPRNTLVRAREIARDVGLQYVYIGNAHVGGACDTVCPKCGRTVVKRAGFVVLANDLKNGRCKHCETTVSGIWTK